MAGQSGSEFSERQLTPVRPSIHTIHIQFLTSLLSHALSVGGPIAPCQKLNGSASLTLSSEFYNPTVVVWESLIEPWSPNVALVVEEQADISIECNDPFNVNLSTEVLTVILETSAMLLAKRNAKAFDTQSRNTPMYLFKNLTGLDLELYLSRTKGQRHAPGEAGEGERGGATTTRSGVLTSRLVSSDEVFAFHTADSIDGEKARGDGNDEAEAPTYASVRLLPTTGGGLTEPDMAGEMAAAAGREEVGDFSIQAAGRVKRRFKPADITDDQQAELVMQDRSTVFEDTWQFQRRNDVTRKWNPPFMPGDPADEWCDEQGSVSRPKHAVQLPGGNEGSWVWLSDWNLEPSGQVGVTVDEDGWEYASGFSSFGQRQQGRAIRRDVDSCRRRRWRRVRSPKIADLADPCRPLSVVWEVIPDAATGRTVIEAGSTLRVRNCTGVAINVGAFSQAWEGGRLCGTVEAHDTMHVPVTLAYALSLGFLLEDG